MDNKPTRTDAKKSELTSADVRAFKKSVMTEKTGVMDPIAYAQTKQMAADFIRSGSVSRSFSNTEQVLMALMAGREMGMSTMESLNDLYFVSGSLNIFGKATPAALRRHGWRIRYSDESDQSCTATVKHIETGEEISDTYTYDEADKSGFTKDSSGRLKLGWRLGANRKRKLRYGVLSLIIHTYLPEVIGGAAGIGEYSVDYMEAESNDVSINNNIRRQDKLDKLNAIEVSDENSTD